MRSIPQTTQKWLALNKTNLSSREMSLILEWLSSGQSLFSNDSEHLLHGNFTLTLTEKIQSIAKISIEEDIQWLEEQGHHAVTIEEDNYPALLRHISIPPLVLYVWGNLGNLSLPQIAIVGSRHASPVGLETTKQFAYYLAKQGFAITSGLALGIDAASHEGALKAECKTIAVLGSGLKNLYPARNIPLAKEIVEKGGTVISEFPLHMGPLKNNFPRRNRIISGLSLGVLVVEAALRSGSLITAGLAAEQGREVFAIPGSIHNPLARGCHSLIAKGAKLVETAQDIVDELGPLLSFEQQQPHLGIELRPYVNLTKEVQKLLRCFDEGTNSIDLLVTRSGYSPSAIATLLTELEMKGYIQPVPSGYCRVLHP